MIPDAPNLWSAYSADRSVENRNRLVTHYIQIVDILVHKFVQTNRQADSGDLKSYGHEALIWCVERYDPTRERSFFSFAFGRIKGALIDACREADPISRSYRTRIKRWQNAEDTLRATTGRPPSDQEVESHLSIRPGLWKAAIKQQRQFGCMIEQADDKNFQRYDFTDETPTTREVDPFKTFADKDDFDSMLKGVVLRKEHEAILRMRFQDDLSPTEIARRLNVKVNHVGYVIWKHGGRIAHRYIKNQLAA